MPLYIMTLLRTFWGIPTSFSIVAIFKNLRIAFSFDITFSFCKAINSSVSANTLVRFFSSLSMIDKASFIFLLDACTFASNSLAFFRTSMIFTCFNCFANICHYSHFCKKINK